MLRQAALIALSGSMVIAGGLLALAYPAEANDAAAHALAERFAGAAEPQARPAPDALAVEPSAEADARRLAGEARQAASEARAAAERLKAEEEDMLKAARDEAAARLTAEAKAATAAKQKENTQLIAVPASTTLTTESSQPPSTPTLTPAVTTLVAPLPAARLRDEHPPMALGAPLPAAEESHAPQGLLSLGLSHAAQRVAVLLAMEPGDRGIRRFNKTADPILCVGGTCYRSKGAGQPAEAMTKARAFGPLTTFGARAGSCRQSLTCVFRGIELPGGQAMIEPVDLKVLIHDRRPVAMARPDASCRARDGGLTCTAVIAGKGWKAWIVPEAMAEKAGPTVLAAAVRSSLGTVRAAGLAGSPAR